MTKKVIITGSTGMVGKGVLLECLQDKSIQQVIAINRSSLNITHPKLKEIIHQNFLDFEPIKDELNGIDACFHIMGVSSFGMSEQDYFKLTYSVTEALANVLFNLNKNITFTYVTGAGTDSSENGRIMWARIKGKTENLLFNKGFKDVYAFRPGGIIPEKGVSPKVWWIKMILLIAYPIFPILRLFPSITSTTRIGKAMIHVLINPLDKKILVANDINQITKQIKKQ